MTAETISYRFVVRRGLAAAWTATNDVLLAGEWGLETDTKKLKMGDGATAWTALPYLDPSLHLAALGDVDNTALADGMSIVWSAAKGKHIYKKAAGNYQPGIGITIDSTNPDAPVIASTVAAVALKGRVATYASLPGSGNTAGDAYLVDADGLVYVWSGTAWPANGAGLAVSGGSGDIAPKIANFPTVVGSGATITDKNGRMDVQLSNAVFMHALYQTCPAPPYTIDAHVSLELNPTNLIGGNDAIVAGLALSDGTKVRGFYMGFWGSSSALDRLSIDSWTNSTTFGAQVSFQAPFKQFTCDDHRIRITDNGTNRIYYLSRDGKRFFQVYSEASNTYVTPSLVGLFFHSMNTLSVLPGKASLLHYKVTNSILGDAP